jgi:hypothetical protein
MFVKYQMMMVLSRRDRCSKYANEINTVTAKGTVKSNTKRCSTITTRYNLNADPMVRLIKKIVAAVL